MIMSLCFCVGVYLHLIDEGMCMKKGCRVSKACFYKSSMSVACGVAAGGRLWWLVVVGVGEDQTLRGRGGRWFSSSTHRLLQQRGEVQTTTEKQR